MKKDTISSNNNTKKSYNKLIINKQNQNP